MRKLALYLVLAFVMFLFGYGVVAKAYPGGGLWGRAEYRGYFHNASDSFGTHVFPVDSDTPGCPASGGNAIPTYINSASEFISFVLCKLNSTNNYAPYRARERTGAAFIIQTMVHPMSAPNYDKTPDASVITEWQNRVNYSQSQGLVSWNYGFSYTLNSYYQGSAGSASPDDDAFYDDVATHQSIIFRNSSGTPIYGVKYICANPVGTDNFNQVPDDVNFNMDGFTTVNGSSSNINVVPGQQLIFSHTLDNDGPTATTPQSIAWTVRNTISGSVTGSGSASPMGVGTRTVWSNETVNVPTSATVGTQFCRRIEWSPDTQGGGSGVGATRCATVVRTFTLTPSVTPSSTIAQQGDTVQFTYRITNSGPHATSSAPAVCKAVAKLHPPGTQLPEEFIDRNSDAGQTPPTITCPASIPGNNSPTTIHTENLPIGTQAPGTKICRSLVINPYNTSGGTFRASAEACVTVAKTPWVHFMGGDVWAGGGIAAADGTCTTNSNAKITTASNLSSNAGSTVEYAAFALNTITRFGSGSKPMHNSADFAALGRRLTFSNNTTTLGRFGAPQHCINDYSADYESAPALGVAAVNVGAQGSGSWHRSGNLTISGDMPLGGRQVYLVDGDVTINANVRYGNGAPTYSSAAQIPSLLVIAKGNIFIGAAATQLDGMYIARNTFYTCYPKPTPPTINTCNSLLTVNGTVIAGTIDFYRTRGADGATPASRQLPAEIFNFSPEVFLNNVLTTSNSQTVTTSDSRELPARF